MKCKKKENELTASRQELHVAELNSDYHSVSHSFVLQIIAMLAKFCASNSKMTRLLRLRHVKKKHHDRYGQDSF